MTYDPNLIKALEPGQMTVATGRALPRRRLGRGTLVLMVAMRVYVILAIPLVAYAFISALLKTP